jgi:hypothetical protein
MSAKRLSTQKVREAPRLKYVCGASEWVIAADPPGAREAVPKVLVCDNLKAGVAAGARIKPDLPGRRLARPLQHPHDGAAAGGR